MREAARDQKFRGEEYLFLYFYMVEKLGLLGPQKQEIGFNNALVINESETPQQNKVTQGKCMIKGLAFPSFFCIASN